MTTMTYDEWEAKYRPGERITFLHDPAVRAADSLTVWTEVDCDGKDTIVNGYHYVNREAYFICEVPFVEGEFIEVPNYSECNEAELDDAAEEN